MLFDRPNWSPHRPWFIFVVALLLASVGWFLSESLGAAEWPGGSSLPGFTFGVVGGLIIVFEFLLWFRKKVRVWRIGRAQTWLRAHIWLGLLCLPVLLLHSGLRFGGTLSTVLMALLIIVIASGVWGLYLQNLLPKKMFEEVPAETIYSQMDFLSAQLLAQADQLVSATCGTRVEAGGAAKSTAPPETGPLVVGAVRSVGNVQGKVLGARAAPTEVPESEPLVDFYRDEIAPFLRQGTPGNARLGSASKAAVLFQSIRTRIPPAAHETVTALEGFCEQRRQWEVQARLHFWLHSWLWVHFPLSVALMILMAVHVFVALKYW